jgi:hypothetical protein
MDKHYILFRMSMFLIRHMIVPTMDFTNKTSPGCCCSNDEEVTSSCCYQRHAQTSQRTMNQQPSLMKLAIDDNKSMDTIVQQEEQQLDRKRIVSSVLYHPIRLGCSRHNDTAVDSHDSLYSHQGTKGSRQYRSSSSGSTSYISFLDIVNNDYY